MAPATGSARPYNDDDGTTPGIAITARDRMGRPLTITDAAGTRTLSYEAGQLASETIVSSDVALNGMQTTTSYDALGRRAGLEAHLSSGQIDDQTIGYGTDGRVESIGWTGGSATYGWKPQTTLLETLTYKDAGGSPYLVTTRTYERGHLLDAITNVSGATTVASHDYSNGATGLRDVATLEDGSLWDYDYNTRDEVTNGVREKNAVPVPGHEFSYNFDTIGNRTAASRSAIGMEMRAVKHS